MEYLTVSWWDYLLFSVVLIISIAIGIYYGFYKKGQSTVEEYSFGGQDVKVFPVAMSLAATVFSGTAILLFPVEVYSYGVAIWALALAVVPTALIVRYIYLPVFYKLNIKSLYEYLEIRFSPATRKLGSFLYICYTLTYLPLAVYVPALALNQVTGLSTNIVGPIMMLLCTCYTAMGGFRAVVWADTLQMGVIVFALLATIAIGSISMGGLGVVWKTAELGDRLQFFNLDPDPTARDTFWTVFVGNVFFLVMHIGLTPSSLQRIMSTRKLGDSNSIIVVSSAVFMMVTLLTIVFGMLIYGRYHDCDPLAAKEIAKIDQLVPYYIMDVGREMPGLNGIFVAGLFCAAFSTASTILNVLPGVIYVDFLVMVFPKSLTERRLGLILKLLTVLVGLVALCLVLVVGKFGTMFEIIFSLGGMIYGPILGVFTMGTLFSVTNTIGALFGVTSSMIVMAWIVTERKMRNVPPGPTKPLNISGCNSSTHFDASAIVRNITNNTSLTSEEHRFPLNLSINYNALLGCVICVVLGVLVSCLTRKRNSFPVNVDAISPLVHRFTGRPNQALERHQNMVELQLLNGISNKFDTG